ncbi:MAG TPA: adenosylcobinamide amidohydrolase, partial [Eubacteriaceae bacterium]|nr:adenosylcobinamide amidohydrolase [Eubacteriaceae bacterium]
REAQYEDLTVIAIVTAGVGGNAARIGDPAFFHEKQGEVIEIPKGTINTILIIDGHLPEGTMARAVVTATEAKTAALQELGIASVYSHGLATGTGTDETVIVSNPQAKNTYRFAGKHSSLGELIGCVVRDAVKEGLKNHANLDARQQFSLTKRLGRFGVTKEKILKRVNAIAKEKGWNVSEEKFESFDHDPDHVSKAVLYAHLLDQYQWEALPYEVVKKECMRLGKQMAQQEDFETKAFFWEDKKRIEQLSRFFIEACANKLVYGENNS